MKRAWVRHSLAGLVAAILAVALAFLFLGLWPGQHEQAGRGGTDTVAPPTAPPPAASATTAPTAGRSLPGTLVIPKIGVKALIEAVTVDSDNNMAAPKHPTNVGWYSPGIVPGQPGDAVIDGHLNWHGMPQAVFYNLNRLRAGDQVDVISNNGARLRFKVTDSAMVAETAHPAGLFASTGSPRLTLITCGGDWNPHTGRYRQRLLVNASYVGTVYE